jgi:DNA topoisomerase-1
MQPPPESRAEIERLTHLCVKATAGLLGNTPAVCRKAYIHPAVLETFAERGLPKRFAEAEGDAYEAAVLTFLAELAAETEPQPHKRPRSRNL